MNFQITMPHFHGFFERAVILIVSLFMDGIGDAPDICQIVLAFEQALAFQRVAYL